MGSAHWVNRHVRVGQTYSDNLKIVVMISKIKLRAFYLIPLRMVINPSSFGICLVPFIINILKIWLFLNDLFFSNGTYDEFI